MRDIWQIVRDRLGCRLEVKANCLQQRIMIDTCIVEILNNQLILCQYPAEDYGKMIWVREAGSTYSDGTEEIHKMHE